MKKNILIVSPYYKLVGGVANHYIGLHDYWSAPVTYEYYGQRERIPAFITFFYDLIKYIMKLIFKRPDVVIINPSFRPYQLIRDGIYLCIASLTGVKVITFIHGWSDEFSKTIMHRPFLFKHVYNKSAFIYVLSCSFKDQLLEMGITKPILLTTTKVDNKMLKGFNIKTRIGAVENILFLARIEEEKGVLIAINAFNILKKKYNKLVLNIVGSGSFLEHAKEHAIQHCIQDVRFTGALFGKALSDEYCSSDIYILPTSLGEGMPTSVLEAMAFGLPVITRPVGGLKDFFDTKKMGSLVDDLSADSFANELESFIVNPEKTRNTALFNYKYSQERFLASSVANKIEEDIKYLL